jgi:hypothetical protein
MYGWVDRDNRIFACYPCGISQRADTPRGDEGVVSTVVIQQARVKLWPCPTNEKRAAAIP